MKPIKPIKRLENFEAPKDSKGKGSKGKRSGNTCPACPDCKEDMDIDFEAYFREGRESVDLACNFCRAEIRVRKVKGKISIELIEKGHVVIPNKKTQWINSGFNVEE